MEMQDMSGNTAIVNNDSEEERILRTTRRTGIIIAAVTAMTIVFTAILVIALSTCLVGAQLAESLCPSVFRYGADEQGRWYGELTLRSEFTLVGLWVRVEFNKKVQLVGSTFDAEIVTDDNQSFLFRNHDFTLHPDTTITLPFFVRYSDLEAAPEVRVVRLNGRPLCPAPAGATPRISPCPSVLLYDEREDADRWYGKLTLRSDVELQGTWVRVVLDTPAELVGTKFGEVKSTDNQAFVFFNRDHTLKPGETLEISFFVKYSPLSAVPGVQVVRLNARTICGPLVVETNTISNLTRTIQLSPVTSNVLPPPPPLPLQVPQPKTPTSANSAPPQKFVLPPFRCGIRELGERIFFGIPTTIEQYPWHGAICHSTEYVCGMSLISPYHAVTAAHCFYNSFRQPVDISSVNLHFGVSNIRKLRSVGVQTVKIAELFKHPLYEYHVPRYDIAVIKFDRQVTFNERIQPVCLWQEDVDLRTVENKGGVVVGFGLTEVGTRSDQLLWGRILVVDSDTCRELNPTFYVNLTKFSYCAGNLTRSTVCRGDSGGGMFFQKPGTEIWQIRGITSTSKPNGLSCDNDYYAIFTDVARYKDWVEEQMRK